MMHQCPDEDQQNELQNGISQQLHGVIETLPGCNRTIEQIDGERYRQKKKYTGHPVCKRNDAR